MNDVLIGKQQSLDRCLARVRHAWAQPSTLPFEEDYDKQDIIVLNLQRACEQAIDMANHVVNVKKLGWPRTSGESFDLLARAGMIPVRMAANMKAMVGLRNVVVHQYQEYGPRHHHRRDSRPSGRSVRFRPNADRLLAGVERLE